ncbi:hypothetical protein MNBD_GAMMA04-2346 [hydrothermal vent metagenome]|uniref:Lcl C-terminal domain-containing protein n=1 Tax=hydrothermal vent metagenome TaxID=652676 RepID=A0A3B0W5N7_9ZZZZ
MQKTTKQNNWLRGMGLALFSLPFLLFTQAVLAQTCNANAVATTPDSDFTEHNDGTVTHKETGLMWKVCSEGQAWSAGTCTGSSSTYTWDAALQIPETLNASVGYPSSSNYTDWRLPNVKELKSITELKCFSPAINETVFPSTASSWYWSSSPDANTGSGGAWGVHFYNGYDDYGNDRISSYRVRLVRSGQ